MVTIHRFSKTQINMFTNDCQMRWMWRYLEGKKTKPSGAMKLGGSIHETAAHNFIQKADTATDLPMDEQTDFFAEALKTNLESEEVAFDEDETPGTLKDQGIGMVRAHHSTLAPKILPKSKDTVEQKIWQLIVIDKAAEANAEAASHLYTLPGPDWRDAGNQARDIVNKLEGEGRELELAYQLDSILDLTDIENVVRELKTSSRTPQQLDADKLVDLSQYSLAYRVATKKAETALAMDVIVKNVRPHAMTLTTRRSREQIRFHLDRIAMMARAIEARAFVPHTDWYGCSPKFCGYWPICAGKGLVTVDEGQNLKPALEKSIEQVKERRGAERQKEEGQGRQEGRQTRKKDGQESRQKGEETGRSDSARHGPDGD